MLRKLESAEQLSSVEIGEVVIFDGKVVTPMIIDVGETMCSYCILRGDGSCSINICVHPRFSVKNKNGVVFAEVSLVSTVVKTTALFAIPKYSFNTLVKPEEIESYIADYQLKPIEVDDEYFVDLMCSSITLKDYLTKDWRFKK